VKATGGPEQAGFVTAQLKSVDPVVNLATLEEILDPVADGGSDGPQSLDQNKSLYCWTSL
jgi:hypothetical protein